ncbi:radical SAM protein [Microbispora sp. NBC_01389]|uniref:radical SAM protein n=1 Tax=Microbispora sp. NBC_01389 TaxID=2903584 RepID=UPI00324E59F3
MPTRTLPGATPAAETAQIGFLWLEITGRCQLNCARCYASSGPAGTHGTMTSAHWQAVIDDAARLGATMVQFIGGEPTLHPALPSLAEHALGAGIEVEIYTNLVHVTPALWDLFRLPGVRLATSWYSELPAEHEQITRRPTHERTLANIRRAAEFGIPLRAGVVGVLDQQRTAGGITVLERAGVADIGYDDLRQVGRGVRNTGPGVAQLCGRCGDRKAAISPTGQVWPYVFARWMPAGSVLEASLAEIVTGAAFRDVVGGLREAFGRSGKRCEPDRCAPEQCNPKCGPSCSPACAPQNNCRPTSTCSPAYGSCNPDKRLCNPDRDCQPNKCRPTS